MDQTASRWTDSNRATWHNKNPREKLRGQEMDAGNRPFQVGKMQIASRRRRFTRPAFPRL